MPENASQIKEKILSLISVKGPSLPIHLARGVNLSPLFVSAFLSELYSEGKIRISDMKVGSSPLYILPGQEEQLENFIEYLNPKEKEAFHLIKKNKMLDDEQQTPVMRVALRALKDFAIPLKIRQNDQVKNFWKYHLIQDSEIQQILQPPLIAPQITLPSASPMPPSQTILELPKEKEMQEINESPKKEEKEVSKPIKKKKKEEYAFPERVKAYLASKDIEVLEILLEKKKDFMAKIRADTLFGKQEYMLTAKDKKKLNETDLTLAYQKAHGEKMPALILSPGEIDKKALEHAKTWRNLIKFEKAKI
ncbi:hypothetical protein KW787_01035 [Candidatus Pacearchaeota archaeon]|nr:hypothetical protein [Candidatus Pacearchaeota archaeon]